LIDGKSVRCEDDGKGKAVDCSIGIVVHAGCDESKSVGWEDDTTEGHVASCRLGNAVGSPLDSGEGCREGWLVEKQHGDNVGHVEG